MNLLPSNRPTVLVVDDKKNMLRLMAKILKEDAQILTADNGQEALRIVRQRPIDVVLCDLRMPDLDGIEVLKACKKLRAQTEFVLMTAYASVGTAIDALRLGAYDYLTKPFEPEAARAVVLRALGRALPSGDSKGDDIEVLPGMIGQSKVMVELSRFVRQVAKSQATVLLLGETGTGKERVARAVHRLSSRSSARFVAVNCAAIPAELLESELFGHAKGAFTGATKEHTGLFGDAHKGTLFLDEIGEMRLSLQAKLTRALEERAIRRLGESRERKVDVRLIAATHRDIEGMVQNESFREDLWYRLNIAAIRLPPLRDRQDDIERLSIHFLRERPDHNRRIVGFTTSALKVMQKYDWPGNVRQLRAAVERAGIVCLTERIDVVDLPPEVVGVGRETSSREQLSSLTWAMAQKKGRFDIARGYLEELLQQHDGQITQAAAHAAVERESFYRLLRRYKIDPDRYRK